MKRFLYPSISPRMIPGMLGVMALGALLAGFYGVLHDFITFSISEEYFTKFKFHQFSFARPDQGNALVFAGRIGFLASWWVGALVCWIFARLSVGAEGKLAPPREFGIAFLIAFSTSALVAGMGGIVAKFRQREGGYGGWEEWMAGNGIEDMEAFMVVGYIHNGSYIGGVMGGVAGVIYLNHARRRRHKVDLV